MLDKKLMNQVDINEMKKILKNLYEFCTDAGLDLSFKDYWWTSSGIKKLMQIYFPYIINPSAQRRLKFLENNLISGKSLDAGCGTGWVDFWLIKSAKNKIDITLGDLSDNSLKQTKILFDFFGINKDTIKFDINCLPFPNENFDNVICFSVLEHVPSLELGIKEIHRVLKPNGRLIIALPNKTGCYSLINDRFGPAFLSMISRRPISKTIESYHEHLHGFNWWKNIIEKNGFDYIDSTNIEFLTPLFSLSASLLKISRANIYRLASVDDKISKYLPKFMASDWMISFEKKKEAKL
jgi:ubiquinone/menaquinone biosynthesis C-methylase UbiE